MSTSAESQACNRQWTRSFSMPKTTWLYMLEKKPWAVMRSLDADFNRLERKSKQRYKLAHLFSLQLLVFTTLCKQRP